MAKHKHHDMIVEWAKDTSRTVQWSLTDRDGDWLDCTSNPHWDAKHMYRFKPEESTMYLLKAPFFKENIDRIGALATLMYAYSDNVDQMRQMLELTKNNNMQVFKITEINGLWKNIQELSREDLVKLSGGSYK